MKFEYRDGLLFTTIILIFEGRTKIIDNIVIDTGASHTLISQDVVDELGIRGNSILICTPWNFVCNNDCSFFMAFSKNRISSQI